jgi:hypothetical protein
VPHVAPPRVTLASPKTPCRTGNGVIRIFRSLSRAEDDVEIRCTATILHAAMGDWRAAGWWLERRRPVFYARRLEPEAVAVAEPVKVTVHFDTPLRDQETLALDA